MQDMTYAEASLIYASSDSRVNTEPKMIKAKVPEKTNSQDLSANVMAGPRPDLQTRNDIVPVAGHHVMTDQSELRKRTPRNVDEPAADREKLDPSAEGTDAIGRVPTHCGGTRRCRASRLGTLEFSTPNSSTPSNWSK